MKHHCRQARGLRLADECRQDLRYAIRSLRRQPGFGLTATLTLGVGLGLAIGLFAVVDAVLLRPLPFADQDELVVMWEKDDGSNNPHIEVSLPNFEDWRAEAGSFVDMAAMGSTTWGEAEAQQDPPVRLTISAVSASFFDTLGVQAFVGRTFVPEEDEPEAPRVLVLSHATWRQYFDMDPDVVGSTVPVGARREPFTVIGVMPPAFQFPSGAEVWTPVGREQAGSRPASSGRMRWTLACSAASGSSTSSAAWCRAARWLRGGRRWTSSCRDCGNRTSPGGVPGAWS